MSILVITKSKHGGPGAGGFRIAEGLRTHGLLVDVLAVGDIESIEEYDTVILSNDFRDGDRGLGR
jgi:menaquinone-dependent protoporphyrinogen IX oxidase